MPGLPVGLDKKTIRRLDLAVERNRTAALQADGAHSLRALFTNSRPAASGGAKSSERSALFGGSGGALR